MASKADNPETVRIYAVPGQFIVGVPAVDQDVTPKRAKELLGWGGPDNPAFAAEPPAPRKSPPDEATEQPTGPAKAGSLDSTEV